MNWKKYNSEDFKHLNNKIEVKTEDGKIHSIWNIVGVTILKNNLERIEPENIIEKESKKYL